MLCLLPKVRTILHLCTVATDFRRNQPKTMAPFKNFSKNPSWHNRLRRGSMYVAVAVMLASCSSDNGGDWEQVTVTEPTKGVITTLEETSADQFVIVDEQVVENKNDSRIIVKRLSGAVDTLNLDQAKKLVQPSDTVRVQTANNHHHHHGMGNVLWWGAMGYLMGRNFGTPSQSYVYQQGAYSRSTAGAQLQQTAVKRTEMRPVKGRSGFFRNSSRGGGAGA
jgi:hypothetical protein